MANIDVIRSTSWAQLDPRPRLHPNPDNSKFDPYSFVSFACHGWPWVIHSFVSSVVKDLKPHGGRP